MSKKESTNPTTRHDQEQVHQSLNQTTDKASSTAQQDTGKGNDPKSMRGLTVLALFPVVMLVLALILRKCS